MKPINPLQYPIFCGENIHYLPSESTLSGFCLDSRNMQKLFIVQLSVSRTFISAILLQKMGSEGRQSRKSPLKGLLDLSTAARNRAGGKTENGGGKMAKSGLPDLSSPL